MKALLALLLTTSAATAQTLCDQHDTLVTALADKYGEQKQSAGLTNNQVMEIYANNETGTWTVLMVNANGLACLVAAGTIWLTFEQEPEGEPM